MNAKDQLSKHRLGGEPVPEDLGLLLAAAAEFERRTGIRIADEKDWAPWADASYLITADLDDPVIVANIKAIAEVCSHIAFVAAHEDHEYIGYWRGPSGRRIADSPLVCLDNKGQFRLCAGSTFAEAVLARHYDFDELKPWLESLGIRAPSSIEAMRDTRDDTDPKELHRQLQERYVGAP